MFLISLSIIFLSLKNLIGNPDMTATGGGMTSWQSGRESGCLTETEVRTRFDLVESAQTQPFLALFGFLTILIFYLNNCGKVVARKSLQFIHVCPPGTTMVSRLRPFSLNNVIAPLTIPMY